MLGDKDAVATIAVKDLAAARKFYAGTLGLRQIESVDEEVIVFQSGKSKINVYQSRFAGTNQATALTWGVGAEFDGVVQELKSKGVSFEHYDMPGVERQGDVHVAGQMKVAWFKDPDGNILNLINQ
jgi:catechol 2,3-dioxygenase-like lactoylglutathione lyase family enzyme